MTRRNDVWFFEDLVIQVQDQLFRVPRYRFEDGSEIFRLLSPRPLEKSALGCSDDSPLRLEGFTKVDFAHFLNELYSTDQQPIQTPKKDLDTYESILKVSTICGFHNIRQQAIWYMSLLLEFESSAIDQIVLAKTYGVSEWLYNGYVKLANRQEHLTWREIETLGSRSVANVLMLRETRYRALQTDHITANSHDPAADEPASAPQSPTIRPLAIYEMIPVSLTPELRISLAKEFTDGATVTYTQQPVNPWSAGGVAYPVTGLAWVDAFNLESIVFEVEDELYRVPKIQFQRHSEVFKDMFSLPQGPETEGKTEEKPLQLSGVTKRDFGMFLSMLYPTPSFAEAEPKLTLDLWEASLKLSRMWLFDDLRCLSISTLTSLLGQSQMAVKQVILGQTYRVRDWLVSGYLRLAMRETPLSTSERELIGLGSALGVMELQIARYKQIVPEAASPSPEPPSLFSPRSPRKLGKRPKPMFIPTYFQDDITVQDVERVFSAELLATET